MLNTKTLSTKCAFIMFATIEGFREPRRENFTSDKKYEKVLEKFWRNIAMYHFYKISLPEYVDEKVEEYNKYRDFLGKNRIQNIDFPNLNIISLKSVNLSYYKILFSTNKILRTKKNIEKKIEKIKKKVITKIVKQAIKNVTSKNDVIILSNSEYIPSWFLDKAKEKASKKDDVGIIGIPDIIKSGNRCVAFVPKNVKVKEIVKKWTPYDVLDTVCIYVSHNY